MPYCDEKRVIFLHVPKTGGTTIKRLFGIDQLDDPDPGIDFPGMLYLVGGGLYGKLYCQLIKSQGI
jgi:hypothetical protein